MKENIKISIITITYNSEATLEDTIKSIAMQHYDNLEYLIIDGGSTDGTLDIVRRYPNVVTKWISEPDHGISDAFNKGIRLATGELIGIINSDDMLTDNSLNIIAQNIQPDTEVIYGNAIMFGNGQKPYRLKPDSDLNEFYKSMAVIHPSTFVKKEAYSQYGDFKCCYKCCMDRELLLRMFSRGAKFQYIPEDLAKMRLGGVNQRTYLTTTIKEGTQISIEYGMNPIYAKVIEIKKNLKFRAVSFVRLFPFAESIRKVVHSKNTELEI
jgi:glycosyltransferase involved in cell wall biosynthesis